jgi:membrane-bound ClpP family serine protease
MLWIIGVALIMSGLFLSLSGILLPAGIAVGLVGLLLVFGGVSRAGDHGGRGDSGGPVQ